MCHNVSWLGFEPKLCCWLHRSLGPVNYAVRSRYATRSFVTLNTDSILCYPRDTLTSTSTHMTKVVLHLFTITLSIVKYNIIALVYESKQLTQGKEGACQRYRWSGYQTSCCETSVHWVLIAVSIYEYRVNESGMTMRVMSDHCYMLYMVSKITYCILVCGNTICVSTCHVEFVLRELSCFVLE